MPVNIFRDDSKSLPKKDEQIVRVPLEQLDLGGRTSHIPAKAPTQATIQHVPNSGSKH